MIEMAVLMTNGGAALVASAMLAREEDKFSRFVLQTARAIGLTICVIVVAVLQA